MLQLRRMSIEYFLAIKFYNLQNLLSMKKIISRSWLRFTTFILSCLLSMVAFAQDKGIDVDINVKKESAWYQNPVVWVIGGAVFILLLVALLRGGEKKSA